MADLINQYIKKVQKETDDPEMKSGIQAVFDDMNTEIPGLTKPKSSFKAANRRMKSIEDGEETDNT